LGKPKELNANPPKLETKIKEFGAKNNSVELKWGRICQPSLKPKLRKEV